MRPPPRGRWKLVAIAGGAAVAVVIAILITRGTRSDHAPTSGSGPVSSHLVRAGDLGVVDDAQALRAKLEPGLASAARSTPTATDAPKCAAAARGLQPQGAVLVYEATARWQGTPADLFGFSPPGSPATSVPGRPTPTRVYVLARSDCHLLVFQSFAP